MSTIQKRSIIVAGHKTSMSLETEFYEAFKALAARKGQTLSALAEEIDAAKTAGNLSSAIRLYVLADLQARAGDRKHG